MLMKTESKLRYKVGVIGRFGFGRTMLNGQTIKTKTIVSALEDVLGKENILLTDTFGGIRALLRLPFSCLRAISCCDNVIILPAHKGIRVIAPLLALYNCFFRRKLHYVVIGAWLNDMLNGKPILTGCLKHFDWIYAETTSMKRRLEESGFDNVLLMPNFKALVPLEVDNLKIDDCLPCRLCIFSRIMREKGVGTAVEAVRSVNQTLRRTVYTLDIFGQVDSNQQQWFIQLQREFPDEVRYLGEVPFMNSVSVLSGYTALLFPTQFFTEGIPGTVIDAFAAGLPVIASMWENYGDIIDAGTGIGYPFEDENGLEKALIQLAENTTCLNAMREACLRRARDFMPGRVIKILLDKLA